MGSVSRWRLGVGVLLLALGAATASARAPSATLSVDASEAPRNLLHVEETLAVEPGPLTLFYPKWIPGEHGPTGPVVDLVGVRVRCGGADLRWRRDPVEMHAIHLEVPAGGAALDLRFDFVVPPDPEGFTSGASASARLAVVNWNQVLLYPLGVRPDSLAVAASLVLPEGWRFATALTVSEQAGTTVRFAPVSLTRLVDSPVLAGAHLRRVELTGPTEGPPVFLNLAGDSPAALDLPADVLGAHRRLVREALALFGATHYERYEFLVSLSDHVSHFGLEHHESSDDRVGERGLVDEDPRRLNATLLPHEYAHSWNGKYRRPAGLVTGDFSTPYNDELLWVYEGLTTYLGAVLAARAGLVTPEDFREDLALTAAYYDARPGRTWRPLQDTADQAQLLYGARADYDAWRRSAEDFYGEGLLLWLEVDVRLRTLSGGARSLDDFCRAFAGGDSGPPAVRSYAFDDVVAGLESLAPGGWRELLSERLQSLAPRAPLRGLEEAGWRLAFRDSSSAMSRSAESVYEQTDARYSLGLAIGAPGDQAGVLADVIPGTPAAQAGLAPGMKLVAVNGRRYSPEVLKAALKEGAGGSRPLELLVESREFYSTCAVDYHGGERHPWLERIPDRADLLAPIIAPRTPDAAAH